MKGILSSLRDFPGSGHRIPSAQALGYFQEN
jgi:hypothetical protein